MKRTDGFLLLFLILLFAPFILWQEAFDFYDSFNREHGMFTSFVKFAVLATTGELIGLRIQTGKYFKPGFGILPRAIVWGFLGLAINAAFVIFAKGTPAFLLYLGLDLNQNTFGNQLLTAFSISAAMNLVFAPVMMTFHKITDTHIIQNQGTIKGFLKPIHFSEIFEKLNWKVQWDFVFKKTIPFFWIPAHTITFMLPPQYRVLFAAILGIVLGVILAFANQKVKK